jgi:hypothetical protein
MREDDVYSGTTVSNLIGGGRLTATGNGTGVDMRDYEGQALVVLSFGAGGGTTPTLDVKLQDSPDDSTYTDITGKAFTQVTGTASLQTMAIDLNGANRYIRAVRTISGTSPTFDGAVTIAGRKKIL